MNIDIHNSIALPNEKRCSGYNREYHSAYKCLLTMKIVMLLLVISLQSYAVVHAQNVSLSFKNAKLEQVLRSVREQTGYSFVLNGDFKTKAKPVTITLNNESLQDALDEIFKVQPFTYIIDHQIITIISRLAIETPKPQQPLKIQGVVTDEEGNPLPGVTVTVKETRASTITNDEGLYHISCAPRHTLIFSFIGFDTREEPAGNRETVNVVLVASKLELNETVVKGYYTTIKALNTGNVSTVKSSTLEKNTTTDPIAAIEGRVPGLFVYQSSGVTNSQTSVRLRGQNSIANGNDPLYIVDGVPFTSTSLDFGGSLGGAAGNFSPFSNIPMNDIESIDVLKDADATAIYGSRGANGVILITTKKGKAGRTIVDFNVYGGAGSVAKKLNLLNTSQYLDMRKTALENDGVTTIPSSANDINGKWGDINQYTDWQKVLIGGTSNVWDAQGNVSGGNENTQFLFGGKYHKDNSVFPGNYNDIKMSGHINLTHKGNNGKFKSNVSLFYQNDKSFIPSVDFTSYILMAPNTPAIYNQDGTLNWQNSSWFNPLWYTTVNTTSTTDNLNSSINLSYSLSKNLTVNLRSGYNDIKFNSSTTYPYTNYDPSVTVLPDYRVNYFGSNQIKSWIAEPSLGYNFRLGKNSFETLIGGTFQQNDQSGIGQNASGFSSAALINNIQAATTVATFDFIDTRYRYSAIYGRIGYNYDDQYLINLTGRRDASSRFGSGRQFANLGAIGAAWIFSKQKFLYTNFQPLSFGKIRASYGITGNDQLTDYQFLSTYSSNGLAYQGISGLSPTSLTNENFGWETVKKLEFGIDLGFFNDRVLLSGSWYKNRTGNQLVGYSLPFTTGFTSIQANLPAVIQNTGTEFEFTTVNIKTSDLTWTTSGNISFPRNKLIAYPDLSASSYATKYVVGQPLSIALLYKYTGKNPNTNVYTFEDKNKDGGISRTDDTYPIFVGQNLFGGLNNSMKYKQFQIDIFFQFVKQNAFELLGTRPGYYSSSGSNQLASVFDSEIQKFTQSSSSAAYKAYSLYQSSDAVITDASYLRLKNLTVSWNAPKKLLSWGRIERLRVYLQGQNLITITSYNGTDPEVASGGSTGVRGLALLKLPPLRMFTAGLQISF